MHIRITPLLLLLLAFALPLSGCGKKGALEPPPRKPAAMSADLTLPS